MVIGFSEFTAIVPYLLRALRIKKLFDAREIYCDQNKMPRDLIWKWREKNLIKWFLVGIAVFGLSSIFIQMLLINYGGWAG